MHGFSGLKLGWKTWCFLCLLVWSISARNGEEPLNHYALLTLQDAAIGSRLAGRFKAQGQPVFLVHELVTGLSQGDLMRFQDKAVLIDADVWQTLQTEGALEKLESSPLVRVTAKGTEAAWSARAKQVKSTSEQMAYLLGVELIKVLQENFGGLPAREQFTMTFDGVNMQLLAPKEFLNQLKVTSVVKAPTTGRPRFISPAPSPQSIVGETFSWQAMAVDPADPDGKLRYRILNELPPGFSFDPTSHILQGKWNSPLITVWKAEIRNAAGAMDTMGFTTTVTANQLPQLANAPKSVVFAGKPWRFQPMAFDADHPGNSIRVLPKNLPPGMILDSVKGEFTWTAPDSLVGRHGTFSLRLVDPLGGESEASFTLTVRQPNEVAWSQGIHVQLPFDTLVQGQYYTWKAGATAAAWADQGLRLHAVIGPDSTNFDGETLNLRPMKAGTHDLLFQFQSDSGIQQSGVSLPVREDEPPYFASSLSTHRIVVGQSAHYRPLALDPEGAAIHLDAALPENSPWIFSQGELKLAAESPGLHLAELIATDANGHQARQMISLQIDPASRPRSWHFENRMQGGIQTWSAAVDFGMGRLGIYTPTLLSALSVTGRSGREWPYLFFGGNLLGREAEMKGNRLVTDLGFTLRLPDPKIATGGVFGRLLGEWTFLKAGFSRVELEFTGHVRQALVLTDTSGIQFIFSPSALQVAGRYDPIVKRIIHDATAKDNAVFFTRLESYARFGYGFSGGMGAWREDFPMDQRFYQRVGSALRYDLKLSNWLGQGTLRSGWGPGNAGWDLYATWKMSLGAAF